MSHVVEEFEIALRVQEISENVQQPMDFEEMSKIDETPTPGFSSKEKLNIISSPGNLVNGGETERGVKSKVEKTTIRPQKEGNMTCPRCESTNTKFCYYNNYSLSQPRYFCKACRRYWTHGGSLRNVPVAAGGSRRSKLLPAKDKDSKPQIEPLLKDQDESLLYLNQLFDCVDLSSS